MNTANVYASSTSPNDLYNNLPGTFGADGDWEVNYTENGVNSTIFYEAVGEAALTGNPNPYRYGSYQIYRASNTD